MERRGAFTYTHITCNNKIIGARPFIDDSIKDDTGHGTHVALMADGNFVTGIAPRAHIAMYKHGPPISAKLWI
jgi:subtilisin family serine protease